MTQRVQGDCLNLPSVPYNYSNIVFPSDILNNITEMDNMPANNPTTDEGATLGRVLFYDVELSKNRKVSCASCHHQQFAFTDTARFSVGFDGQLTHRNSMGLAHARFQKDSAFFWDNRASTLEVQTLLPIQSDVEMGLSLDTLVARVAAKSYYAPLFLAAFGSTTVTSLKISRALAQFIRSMNTFGSKYRIGVNSTNGNPSIFPLVNLTAEENLGKDLFMDERRGNCQACHTRNIFVSQGSKNIGLDLVYADNGVGAAFNNPTKNGQFSVPSLINVALTAPYMHDGRYKTLEQVVNFYSDSIKPHPNLDGFLRTILPGTIDPNNNVCDTCPPRIIQYTETEKRALVAFMKTMTDTVLTTDARWSNPFCTSSTNPQLEPVLGWGVYPTPLKRESSLNVKLIAGQSFAAQLHVFSSDGKLLYRQSHSISPGSNFITVTNLFHGTGTYLIQLSRNNKPIGVKQVVVLD
jgi:cytochrome c peroxidase